MEPLFDNRKALEGKPGMHALIIGISDYPHLANMPEFNIYTNTSGAITGYRIYQWLVAHQQQLAVPLATCRLMVAPSAEEIAGEPALQELAGRCTVEDFLYAANAWREDAQSSPDNMTFLYFAGNGFELSKSNPIIMLQDFGNGIGPVLRGSITVNNVFYGMGPTERQPQIARTQLYFVDTDRVYPARTFQAFEEMNTTAVFDAVPLGLDDRDAVIFYATSSGSAAYAYTGDVTLFSDALLRCLDGAAAVPGEMDEEGSWRWRVSITSMMNGIDRVLAGLNQETGLNQKFEVGGQARDAVICYLDEPPAVDLQIEVEPAEAAAVSHLELQDEEGEVVLALGPPLMPHPYRINKPAGYYTLKVSIEPADPRFKGQASRVRLLTPPRAVWKVKVAS
ncbi:MAG: hypothetical protein ACJ74G_08910 [Blastocatellia bacterium]